MGIFDSNPFSTTHHLSQWESSLLCAASSAATPDG